MTEKPMPAVDQAIARRINGRLTGQKRPLKPRDVWTIRVRLQLEGRKRDLAMFNLGIDSKLRGCDLVRLQVSDVCVGGRARDRAAVVQKKTGFPVQFELTEQTRSAVEAWLDHRRAKISQYLFPSSLQKPPTYFSPTIRAHRAQMGDSRWAG